MAVAFESYKMAVSWSICMVDIFKRKPTIVQICPNAVVYRAHTAVIAVKGSYYNVRLLCLFVEGMLLPCSISRQGTEIRR